MPHEVKRCTRCILYEGMRFHLLRHQLTPALVDQFSIADDGVCSLCRAYEARMDKVALDAELATFLMAHPTPEAPPAIVAVSGGKDSLNSLLQCVRTLNVPCVAVLYDNGYIPDEVIEQSVRFCEHLEVPLTIAKPTAPEHAAFTKLVEGASSQKVTPCSTCSGSIFRAIDAKADELGSTYVVLGTNYHASFGDRVSASSFRRTPSGRTIRRLHLPFAMRLTHAQTVEALDELGAVIHKQRGASSNCRVPELVQNRVAPELGHPTELEDMALEIMAGHLTRASALEELERIWPS